MLLVDEYNAKCIKFKAQSILHKSVRYRHVQSLNNSLIYFPSIPFTLPLNAGEWL